jgi:aspartate/methionine/tyrosine aminotransferase
MVGLILSSPSNPTGGMLSSDQLRELCEVCKKNGIVFISDEIYHGITYGTQKEATVVSFSDLVRSSLVVVVVVVLVAAVVVLVVWSLI